MPSSLKSADNSSGRETALSLSPGPAFSRKVSAESRQVQAS